MIVPVMAISNLVLTQQIYSEETNGAHAHYREPVSLKDQFVTHPSDYKSVFDQHLKKTYSAYAPRSSLS